jgi:hypothetical protein
MRLEKVAQSSIKGPILTSEVSPCFIVLVIIKIDSNSIKVHALLDFGAFACFMNKDFGDRHKLPLITKKHLHLELGRQWKVTVFYMICVKGRVRIFNTKNLYGNNAKKLCM